MELLVDAFKSARLPLHFLCERHYGEYPKLLVKCLRFPDDVWFDVVLYGAYFTARGYKVDLKSSTPWDQCEEIGAWIRGMAFGPWKKSRPDLVQLYDWDQKRARVHSDDNTATCDSCDANDGVVKCACGHVLCVKCAEETLDTNSCGVCGDKTPGMQKLRA